MSIPRKHLLLLPALAIFSLLLPTAALAGATSPTAGVHVDPGSPVAKEYALPLANARGAPADTGSNGSLFGSGIKKSSGTPKTHSAVSAPNTSTATTVESKPPPTPTGTTVESEPPPVQTGGTVDSEPPLATTGTSVESKPPTTTSGTASPAPKQSSAGRKRHPGQRTAPAPTPQPVTSPVSLRSAPDDATAAPAAMKILRPGSGSSWLWTLLVALIVLAVGGCGGLMLVRARHGQDPSHH